MLRGFVTGGWPSFLSSSAGGVSVVASWLAARLANHQTTDNEHVLLIVRVTILSSCSEGGYTNSPSHTDSLFLLVTCSFLQNAPSCQTKAGMKNKIKCLLHQLRSKTTYIQYLRKLYGQSGHNWWQLWDGVLVRTEAFSQAQRKPRICAWLERKS